MPEMEVIGFDLHNSYEWMSYFTIDLHPLFPWIHMGCCKLLLFFSSGQIDVAWIINVFLSLQKTTACTCKEPLIMLTSLSHS